MCITKRAQLQIHDSTFCTAQVVDDGAEHAIAIRRDNFPDAVVWNPWVEKAKATADFGDAEYQVRRFISFSACQDPPARIPTSCSAVNCGSYSGLYKGAFLDIIIATQLR